LKIRREKIRRIEGEGKKVLRKEEYVRFEGRRFEDSKGKVLRKGRKEGVGKVKKGANDFE
jgi:hypothetical protein